MVFLLYVVVVLLGIIMFVKCIASIIFVCIIDMRWKGGEEIAFMSRFRAVFLDFLAYRRNRLLSEAA